MHDLRAAPRWSKTTVVVVLVVFGLVLIVAVAILWGWNSFQESQAKAAREAADVKARSELELLQRELGIFFRGLLGRAERGTGPKHLQTLRLSSEHGRFVREMFLYEDTGVFRWVDPAYRVFVPADLVREEAREQAKGREECDRRSRLVTEKARKEGALAALPDRIQLVDRWGLLQTTEVGSSRPYAHGLALTRYMVKAATQVAAAQEGRIAPATARRVLLLAAEMDTLWQGHETARGLTARLDDVRSQMEALLLLLPKGLRDDLDLEIKRYRQYVALLRDDNLRVPVTSAVRKLERSTGRFVLYEQPELLGIARVGGGYTTVLRLRAEEVADFVRQRVEAVAWGRRGGRAAVFDLDQNPAFAGEPATVELSLDDPKAELPFRLPFRLAFFRTGDPLGDPRAVPDLLLWVLIALALAGMGVGGYVLVRLLNREIHVARLKADFVSNISHELKTPITSISLFTEMLDEGKLTDPEEQAEAFSVMANEAQRLQGIVARMLTVARGEARRNPYVLELGDLNEVVREVADRFRRITTDPGLDLDVSLIPGHLPMQMDRQGMDDVVTNLLSNAWKYKRGDRVRITVRTARRGRYAELVVSDDGVGIPREERRRVFEMFYRADQLLTDQVAGTGLGLALVRSAVREHKGTVRIEAGVGGRGAAFRLRFPLDLMGIVAEESASLGLSADSRGKLDGEPGGTAPASAQGNPGPPDGGPGNQT